MPDDEHKKYKDDLAATIRGSSDRLTPKAEGDTSVQGLPPKDEDVDDEPKAKPKDDPKVEPKTTEDKDDASERLPWDKTRQKGDQEKANLRKELERENAARKALLERIERLEAGGVADPVKALAEARKAMKAEKKPEPLDTFATDEEQAAHHRALAKHANAMDEHVATVDKLVEIVVTKTTQKTEPDPEPEEEPAAEGATSDDYRVVLDACDAEYGPDLRAKANAKIQLILRKRRDDGDIPSVQALEDLSMRVYADLRRTTDSTAAPKPEPKADTLGDGPTPKPASRFGVTLRQAASKMRRGARKRA